MQRFGLLLLLPLAAMSLQLRAENAVDQKFLTKHCFECHGEGAKKGELAIDTLGQEFSDAETMRRWVRIYDRVAAGEMPPKKEEPPPPKDRKKFLERLSATLTSAHLQQKEVVLRRLNRTEYENTIRDLFHVYVDVKNLLPEEVTAHGFDNIGAALASSDALVHAYLEAADLTYDAILGPLKKPEPIKLNYAMVDEKNVKNHVGDMFRKTDAGVAVFQSGYCPTAQHNFRPLVPGNYRVRMKARAFQSTEPVMMSVHVGDVIVHRNPYHLVGYWALPPGEMTTIESTERYNAYDTFHPQPYGTAGNPREKKDFPGPGIEFGDVEVEGPLEAWPAPSRIELLGSADPVKGTADDARAIFLRILPRAFRRDVKPEEAEPYVALVKTALEAKRPFTDALGVGIKGILCSPQFLFLDEPPVNPKKPRLDNFALASRLSYFLWSSMPDEALLDAARSGKLDKPAELRAQVERMLADPKAVAFTENFTGQWLSLRKIDFTEPDQKLYPEFDEALKLGMLRETRGYFARVLNENRSLLEFVSSDWAYINERLAKHYGIPDVKGTQLRVVQLPKDSVRGGILTQAAVLKVTANGTNTSPVLRGVWVLDNILGEPSPPPPPGIPSVEPDIRGATTLRQQLDLHRNSTRCAACHSKIDPPGFALENFDVIGGFRTWYRSVGKGDNVDLYKDKWSNVRVAYKKGPPVDAKGEWVGVGAFDDIRKFKELMQTQPDSITKCLTKKLLTYATGRGMGFSDRPEIERLATAVAKQNYGFKTLIHEIVQSESFHQP